MEEQLNYIEQILVKLICELKNNGAISQEFKFLTQIERKQKLESFIDDFIKDE